jgi:hypothetical protein
VRERRWSKASGIYKGLLSDVVKEERSRQSGGERENGYITKKRKEGPDRSGFWTPLHFPLDKAAGGGFFYFLLSALGFILF